MANQSFLDRHHFLLRRLHSLTGIVPIGVFLIAHLTTNSSLLWGGAADRGKFEGLSAREGGWAYFWTEVEWINTQIPHLLLIEIVLWVSIAFHSVLGVVYATSGKNNTDRYAYQDNKRYKWQRISGYVGIVFIFYHVATLRWQWTFLVPGGTEWNHYFSVSTLSAALWGSYESVTFAGVIVSLLYFAGITLLVFHFANGLWTAAITWGLTISQKAQQRWGYVCAAIGAGLMVAAWSSLAGALLTNPAEARELERQLIAEKYGEDYLAEVEAKYSAPAPERETVEPAEPDGSGEQTAASSAQAGDGAG